MSAFDRSTHTIERLPMVIDSLDLSFTERAAVLGLLYVAIFSCSIWILACMFSSLTNLYFKPYIKQETLYRKVDSFEQ